eukprot:8171367-Pyramimonas_sp.AAC.1
MAWERSSSLQCTTWALQPRLSRGVGPTRLRFITLTRECRWGIRTNKESPNTHDLDTLSRWYHRWLFLKPWWLLLSKHALRQRTTTDEQDDFYYYIETLSNEQAEEAPTNVQHDNVDTDAAALTRNFLETVALSSSFLRQNSNGPQGGIRDNRAKS